MSVNVPAQEQESLQRPRPGPAQVPSAGPEAPATRSRATKSLGVETRPAPTRGAAVSLPRTSVGSRSLWGRWKTGRHSPQDPRGPGDTLTAGLAHGWPEARPSRSGPAASCSVRPARPSCLGSSVGFLRLSLRARAQAALFYLGTSPGFSSCRPIGNTSLPE